MERESLGHSRGCVMTAGLPIGPSARLFGRSVSLTIGAPNNPLTSVSVDFDDSNSTGLDVSGFDMEFVVERTLKPEPNTCEIRILNLSADSRKKLSGVPKLTVRLEAGYKGATELLYLGECRAAWTERDGSDFVTHIESGDGEKEIQAARLNTCLGAKVPVAAALTAIAKSLNLKPGNLAQAIASLQKAGFANINGAALNGSTARRLTDFCRSAGLEWSIQNGALQILDQGAILSTIEAIEVSESTGMVNSPTVDSQGIVSASILMTPGLIPGCLVRFDSLFQSGGYRVQRCKWHGSTFSQDWTIDFEAKKY